MKMLKSIYLISSLLIIVACSNDNDIIANPPIETVNFQYINSIEISGGGEGKAEITAYNSLLQQLYTIDGENNTIEIHQITNLATPRFIASIYLGSYGSPNSISTYENTIAVAIANTNKQANGKVLLIDALSRKITDEYTVKALPDMLIFTPDGQKIVVACEGEPNDTYTIDPYGEISVIDRVTKTVNHINFESFNNLEAQLENQGFRVFGPNASLAADVEPEYVAVSGDSKKAWVSLQENNGIAEVNLENNTITAIYPLGFKNYNLVGNEIDPSDKDKKKELATWPVYGMYQPDAIVSVMINGIEYIVSANEGDSRTYEDGGVVSFTEEKRIEELLLSTSIFPLEENYQSKEKLGRLKVTTTLGDANNDSVYEALYSYGARSFSIWTTKGMLVYDSGNEIAERTLAMTPEAFNNNDKRSDDKGAEPETVATMQLGNKTILFVGLERNDQVLVYDISNPLAPVFIQILTNESDQSPEGIIAIPASESPTGKSLVVISNEGSGTVSIYENRR